MINEKLEASQEELLKFARQLSETENETHDRFIESLHGKSRRITVEPLMMMYVIIMYLQTTVMGQYIYFRIGREYNLTTDSNLAYVCDPTGNNSAEKDRTDKLQNINASYSMYIQLTSCIFTVLTAPFYCIFSDRFGRKAMFLLPGIGLFVKSIFEILIQVLDWPIYVFAFTEGFYGLSGGFNFATGLSYSYIADISTQKMRTKRIAILGIMIAIGALIVSLVSGFWIRASGYLTPYIFSGVFSLGCVFYPLFLLKEPPKLNEFSINAPSPKEQMKRLFTIYWNRPRLDCALLIVVMVTFNFYYVSEMSGISLVSSYLMSYPICMDTVNLSVFGFVNMFAINVGVAITVVVLTRCFTDLPLVAFCLLSGILFSTQMAFAQNQTAVYIAAASNLFSFSAFPFIRGYLSKRVSPNEQGALFGGLVLSETICSAITRVVIIYFYKKTFLIFHGMVYLLITMFAVIAIVLTCVSIALDRKIKIQKEDIDVTT